MSMHPSVGGTLAYELWCWCIITDAFSVDGTDRGLNTAARESKEVYPIGH